MTSCIYAGSFDPIHLGHIDVIENITKIFDKVYVAPLVNKNKKGRFDISDRIKFIEICLEDIPNNEKIEIVTFEGLLADFVKEKGISVIVKGVRNTLDFELEKEMAQSIRMLDDDVKTLLLPSSLKYSSISSTIVYDLIQNKGALESFVPIKIIDLITK